MTHRRRNLIVLVLVLALLVGSALVISSKKTVLGLDLRGGTELVYQGQPTPQVPEVTAEDVDRSIEIIRDRVDSLGVSEPEITRIGIDQVEVGLPDVSDSERAIDQIGTTAQLYLYDFEPNVIPPNPDVANPEDRPYNRLYDAVQAASKQKEVPESQCTECTTNGLVYAFDSNTLEPVGDPAESAEDIEAQFDGELPPNTELVEVPRGTVVLERKAEDDPETETSTSRRPSRPSSSSSRTTRGSPATRSRTRSPTSTSSTSRSSPSTSPTRAARSSRTSPARSRAAASTTASRRPGSRARGSTRPTPSSSRAASRSCSTTS